MESSPPSEQRPSVGACTDTFILSPSSSMLDMLPHDVRRNIYHLLSQEDKMMISVVYHQTYRGWHLPQRLLSSLRTGIQHIVQAVPESRREQQHDVLFDWILFMLVVTEYYNTTTTSSRYTPTTAPSSYYTPTAVTSLLANTTNSKYLQHCAEEQYTVQDLLESYRRQGHHDSRGERPKKNLVLDRIRLATPAYSHTQRTTVHTTLLQSRWSSFRRSLFKLLKKKKTNKMQSINLFQLLSDDEDVRPYSQSTSRRRRRRRRQGTDEKKEKHTTKMVERWCIFEIETEHFKHKF